jgi:hypothetical protein
LYHEKRSRKFCPAYFCHFHIAAQNKQPPTGENSPNLVTLVKDNPTFNPAPETRREFFFNLAVKLRRLQHWTLSSFFQWPHLTFLFLRPGRRRRRKRWTTEPRRPPITSGKFPLGPKTIVLCERSPNGQLRSRMTRFATSEAHS